MTQTRAYVFQNFSTYAHVQNKYKTVSEVLLQNMHRSFSIKPNPNNYELHTAARKFNLI